MNDQLDQIRKEITCYQDGTYTMPWVEGFIPYGNMETKYSCSGCGDTKNLVWWITHNTNRPESNPDKEGNYGNYTQVSKYCDECKLIFDPLSRKIHKPSNKSCVIL